MKKLGLKQALTTLGELLDHRGHTVDLVVIGGGALLLDGLISRPTKDLDAVARVESERLISSERLPKHFQDLVALAPTKTELTTAFDWCRTHDVSETFAVLGAQAIAAVLEAADA